MTVYEPAEDSFLLRDFVSELDLEGEKALDMGTGSGVIAVEMANQGADVTAADINPEALEVTRERAEEAGVDIDFVESDLFEDIEQEFDVITFNPPYLPGEEGVGDEEIWLGGEEGTEVVSEFLEKVDNYLRPGGEAYVILSSRSDYEELANEYDLEIVDTEKLWFEELFVAKHK